MDEVAVWTLLITLFGPVVVFFLFGINGLRRFEDYFSNFYWTFRHAYPHSYVKQDKIIKIVRKCFGMQTKNPIHWMTCFLHYLQVAMLVSPIVMLIVFAFVPTEKIVSAFFLFGFILPAGLCGVLMYVLYVVQYFRSIKLDREGRRNSKK